MKFMMKHSQYFLCCSLLFLCAAATDLAQTRSFSGIKEARPYTQDLPPIDKVELLKLKKHGDLWNGEIENNSSAWQEFSSDKGRYSVLMPGRPTAKTISIPVEGLKIDMYMHSLKTTVRYSISYYDLPVKVDDPVEIKKFLLNTKQGGISGIHWRLLEDREIKLGKYPGYYIALVTPDDSVLRSKSFLVGQRFYQVTINTPREPVPGKSRFFQEVAARFLDSFKLTSQDQ